MIKPKFEDLSLINNESYTVRVFDEPEFASPLHFHPEYELTVITSGCGNRFVGDHMGSFVPGDLILVGANLPHCWKSERNCVDAPNSRSVVIQFKEDFLGDTFFYHSETSKVLSLLRRSKFGVSFSALFSEKIVLRMENMCKIQNPLSKLLLFLDILNELSHSKDYQLLNKEDLSNADSNDVRLYAVNSFIVENFKTSISLEDVAGIANMSPNAFCKFYKNATKRTLMETINTYRINYAMQQLVHTQKTITEVSFESGFSDVSYFSKMFKAKIKESPLAYRKKYMNVLLR